MGIDLEPATLTRGERLEESDEEARGWIALLAEDVKWLFPMSVASSGPFEKGLSRTRPS